MSDEEKFLRGIRTKHWFKNPKNLNIDQQVIEETVKKLTLTQCPVCRRDLSNEDNFGFHLPSDSYLSFQFQEKYCPKDNYIIKLRAHQYSGNTFGTHLDMKIYTNSKHSELIAESGELADFSEHVKLHFF